MVGATIRQAREAARMSQEKAAAAARVDRSYWSLVENDRLSPTLEKFTRICRALGVAPWVVLRRAERTKADG